MQLGASLWTEAFLTAVHIHNRLPTAANPAPLTKLSGRVPDLSTLRTFGCIAHVLVRPEPEKLEPRTVQCYFIGYQRGSDCVYRFWNPVARRVIVSRDAYFDENLSLAAARECTTECVRAGGATGGGYQCEADGDAEEEDLVQPLPEVEVEQGGVANGDGLPVEHALPQAHPAAAAQDAPIVHQLPEDVVAVAADPDPALEVAFPEDDIRVDGDEAPMEDHR